MPRALQWMKPTINSKFGAALPAARRNRLQEQAQER